MAKERATIVAHALDDARIDLTPVRDRRTSVEAAGEFSDPLPEPSNQVRKFASRPLPATAPFPSVAKASAKDRLVSYSVRLKLSQIERLEELKAERGIVPSELLRDFIDRCLPQV
jgi:hypothetical protein